MCRPTFDEVLTQIQKLTDDARQKWKAAGGSLLGAARARRASAQAARMVQQGAGARGDRSVATISTDTDDGGGAQADYVPLDLTR